MSTNQGRVRIRGVLPHWSTEHLNVVSPFRPLPAPPSRHPVPRRGRQKEGPMLLGPRRSNKHPRDGKTGGCLLGEHSMSCPESLPCQTPSRNIFTQTILRYCQAMQGKARFRSSLRGGQMQSASAKFKTDEQSCLWCLEPLPSIRPDIYPIASSRHTYRMLLYPGGHARGSGGNVLVHKLHVCM